MERDIAACDAATGLDYFTFGESSIYSASLHESASPRVGRDTTQAGRRIIMC